MSLEPSCAPLSGALIAVEGLDGGGKTKLVERLQSACERARIPVVLTREPTALPTGATIRARVDDGDASMSVTEAAVDAHYFFADRINHNARVIRPALAAGNHVISDRYELGTLAYQSTQGVPLGLLAAHMLRLRAAGLVQQPNLHLLLDVSAETALKRIAMRGSKRAKFENVDFLRRLRATYMTLDKELPDDTIVILDGEQNESEVAHAALRAIAERVPQLRAIGELP